MTPLWRRLLPLLVSLLMLAAVLHQVGATAVLDRLAAASPGWLALGLLISVPQFLLSALRWRVVSTALGVHLPYRTALREYYLAVFLNNVLPGGILGDGARVWRSGGRGRWAAAVQSVVIERLSGQLALFAIAALALGVLLRVQPALGGSLVGVALPLLGVVALLAAGGWVLGRRRLPDWIGPALPLLVSPRAFVHLGLSLLIVATYLAVYACAAQAIGAPPPLPMVLLLVPWVLLAMLLPSALGGLGVREAAAGALWLGAGLDPGQGVAIAMLYGVSCLLASTPGLVVLGRCGFRPLPHSPGSGSPFPESSGEPVSALAARDR